MTPETHLAAILEGEIGPQTVEWLKEVVTVAHDAEIPLERAMGLRSTITDSLLRYQRNRWIAEGVRLAGGSEALLDRFTRWRLGADKWPDMTYVFEQLLLLEELGYQLPGLRQCQRIAATSNTPSNVVCLPTRPANLSK